MTDHIKMLCDIGEMNSLIAESISIESFLEKVVVMVADHMNAQVCSIYLYDEHDGTLKLKATLGLEVKNDNPVFLKTDEGLVGYAWTNGVSVVEKTAESNPRYKHFPGIKEEGFQAFLAVPVILGLEKIGVLVIQRQENKPFNLKDTTALQATSSQLASMIGNARTILMTSEPDDSPRETVTWSESRFYKGKSASKGFSHAPAVVIDHRESFESLLQRYSDRVSRRELDESLRRTEEQLETLQKKVEEKLDDAASLIFSSHLLILKDRSFIEKINGKISQGLSPAHALVNVFHSYKSIFSSSPNKLIREKVQDLEDLALRILENIMDLDLEEMQIKGHVVILKDLYPSDLLKISVENAQGIVLVSGGVTSHIAILARSLELPMVIMSEMELLSLANNTPVILDADIGNLYISPTEDTIETFRKRNQNRETIMNNREVVAKPAATYDGKHIDVMLNVNLLTDLNRIDNEMTDGIGLYRTEFPFLIRNSFPSEEEQFVIYKKLFKLLPERPITFRTLDIGGDKVLSYYNEMNEQNPFLGMRSIRFSLTHTEVFYTQVRAILRAGYNHQLKIMFPMVSSLEEYQSALEIVQEAKHQLLEEGIPYNENPQLGVMIELPSAVMIIRELASAVDFLSVGSNDLVQYTLGVDRTNEKVAHLYLSHHPAVLRSLFAIGSAAKEFNKSLSICGDMGSNPDYIPYLLGCGFTTFSVDAGYLFRVKEEIRKTSLKDAQKLAEKLTEKGSIEEVERILEINSGGEK
jgi:phosphotransferase system, enzyme I, PtsP